MEISAEKQREISTELSAELSADRVAAVYGALFGFGLAYNMAVEWLEEQGLDEGYTANLVVAGVVATLLILWPVIGLRHLVLVVLGFMASGTPMAAGSMIRFRRRRLREQRRVH